MLETDSPPIDGVFLQQEVTKPEEQVKLSQLGSATLEVDSALPQRLSHNMASESSFESRESSPPALTIPFPYEEFFRDKALEPPSAEEPPKQDEPPSSVDSESRNSRLPNFEPSSGFNSLSLEDRLPLASPSVPSDDKLAETIKLLAPQSSEAHDHLRSAVELVPQRDAISSGDAEPTTDPGVAVSLSYRPSEERGLLACHEGVERTQPNISPQQAEYILPISSRDTESTETSAPLDDRADSEAIQTCIRQERYVSESRISLDEPHANCGKAAPPESDQQPLQVDLELYQDAFRGDLQHAASGGPASDLGVELEPKFSVSEASRKFEIEHRRNYVAVSTIHLQIELRLAKRLQHAVWKIGSTVVKCTGNVRLTEALSMMFVRKMTSIPVPRVLNVFSREEQMYLVMEYIDGTPLDAAWRSLTPEEKNNICSELKRYLRELRELKSPRPGAVEAIDGSACFDTRLRGLFGPFESIDKFHTHFGHDYIRSNPERFPEYQANFQRIAGKQYRTVFTHADIGPYNILVRNGRIAAILDWEFAGWYPEYWEYTRSVSSYLGHRHLRQLLREGALMDVYPDELEVEYDLAEHFVRF